MELVRTSLWRRRYGFEWGAVGGPELVVGCERSEFEEREGGKWRERERENVGVGYGQFGNCDNQGNESGYGSEPRYRGDAELGYDDEEEDDSRVLFWGMNLVILLPS